eukprot:1823618-Prymnesium_polylepis.1
MARIDASERPSHEPTRSSRRDLQRAASAATPTSVRPEQNEKWSFSSRWHCASAASAAFEMRASVSCSACSRPQLRAMAPTVKSVTAGQCGRLTSSSCAHASVSAATDASVTPLSSPSRCSLRSCAQPRASASTDAPERTISVPVTALS